MNVNFFEKKEVNILPYIAGGIFALCLLLMGLYFLLTRAYYSSAIEDNNEWLSANAEEVRLSREISDLDRLQKQTVATQETLRDKQFPMADLTNDLALHIPDELPRVSSFQLSGSEQVSIILEDTETTMGQMIVEDLEAQAYVTQVQFLNAQSQNAEEGAYQHELLVDLNVDAFAEEEAE